ncbi:MAG: oligosaccharide flippase family protein [Pseudomonadota bacterium]
MSDAPPSAPPRVLGPDGLRGLFERVTSPYVVGVGARIGGQIVAFALVMVAARHLSLTEFGTYALAAAAGVIATTFVFTGLYHALLRSTDIEADRDTLFWLQAAVGLLGTLAIIATALAFGGLDTALGGALFATALLPLLAVPNAWNEAQLVRAARARAASLYVLASEALGLVAAILLLNAGWGLYALIAARYVTVLTAIVMTVVLVRRVPRPRFAPQTLRRARGTALPLWGTSGIGMFSAYGADMVLAAFLSPAAVGAYRSGARIATTASNVIFQPLSMLSWSRFARLEQEGDRQGITDAWASNMALSCALLWPILAGVALVAEDLVVTLFDPSWAAAAPVLAILCLSHAVAAPQALMEPMLMCLKRARLHVTLRVLRGLLLLVALLGIGRYGAPAAAWAMVLTAGVSSVIALAVVMRLLALRPGRLLRIYWPGATLALGVAASIPLAAPWLNDLAPPTALACHVTLGAALWAAGMSALVRRNVLTIPKP